MKIFSISVSILLLLSSCNRYFETPPNAKIQTSSEMQAGYSGGNWHSSTTYFIKKEGEDQVVMNGRNLINAVRDNRKALNNARAYKIFKTVSIASFATFFIGITYGIFGKEDRPQLAKTSLKAGMIAFPIIFISGPFANVKARRAIRVYNGF